LHTAGLPPNYLFPSDTDASDMTALDVLLVGPIGTPYAHGLWRLHLDIPPTYPTAPPTATFRTPLWHPNIEEGTGVVCVETLKRDWTSTLKLRDVLVTISCLLIQPNPASALNEAAGKLASEDWEGFCRRAKLMTGIHAAVPRNLVDDVREAQTRGEDKEEVEVNGEVKGKGKEKESATVDPPAAIKVQQSILAGDEENRRRRGDTVEMDSDPESDWIPRPIKAINALPVSKDNIFGIKGLDASMQHDTPRVISTEAKDIDNGAEENVDDSDPFITVPTKHSAPSFNLRLPHLTESKQAEEKDTATPDLLKFSHRNPFSAIQPNNQEHPLLREFSWSWEDSQIMHDTDTIKDGPTKTEVRKRMAGDDFEKRRKWEMKRFKRAGYDLARYNRGDFGPRTGIGRL
jgi:ubiquitin-conjugating enzyme E2 S